MAGQKREWYTPRLGEELPPYPIDVDTLARWLIIQCGSVREARKIITENRGVLRSPRRPKVPALAVLALAERIRNTKPSYRKQPKIALRTAIE
jgi:hypothetical protein